MLVLEFDHRDPKRFSRVFLRKLKPFSLLPPSLSPGLWLSLEGILTICHLRNLIAAIDSFLFLPCPAFVEMKSLICYITCTQKASEVYPFMSDYTQAVMEQNTKLQASGSALCLVEESSTCWNKHPDTAKHCCVSMMLWGWFASRGWNILRLQY